MNDRYFKRAYGRPGPFLSVFLEVGEAERLKLLEKKMSLPIWENENLITYKVRSRNWRQRLFTLPWCPTQASFDYEEPAKTVYKLILPEIPSFDGGKPRRAARVVLMCHPDRAAQIREAVARDAHNWVAIVEAATEGHIAFGTELRPIPSL